MNHNEQTLIDPVGYTPDVDTYFNWMTDGISKF